MSETEYTDHSDSEEMINGYSTAEEDSALFNTSSTTRRQRDDNHRRSRSRSQLRTDNETSHIRSSESRWERNDVRERNGGRERDNVTERDDERERNNERERRRTRRSGRRQRRRNRRSGNRRWQDDRWYFPDENSADEERELESRATLIAENNSWIANVQQNAQELPATARQGAAAFNPVPTRSSSTRAAADDNNDDMQSEQELLAAPAPAPENDADEPIPLDRPVARLQQHHESVAELFNNASADLTQNLADRQQAIHDISQQASQIQVAAAMATASFQQLIRATRLISRPAQDLWQSISSWNDRDDPNNDNSLVDLALSLSGGAEEVDGLTVGPNNREARRNNGRAARRHRHNQRESRGWHNADWILLSQRGGSSSTVLPNTDSSLNSRENDEQEQESDSGNQPFQRFDAAYRRQEERNMWRRRQRRRERRDERRQQREQRQWRREQRHRAQSPQRRSNESLSTNESRENDLVRRPPIALPIPEPPPLPPPGWLPPRLFNNETQGMQENNLTPESLQNLTNRRIAQLRAEEQSAVSHRTEGVRVAQQSSSDLLGDQYIEEIETMQSEQDGVELLETVLKAYIDPADSPTELGVFLRLIGSRGRVVVSRVRKRITKQYFRHGDFHMALADFRRMNPEHSRQVLGVGFTGTVNNMYRLTVKQNSSFGKPTLEIRPMNRRVRRKKIHVCYKIRYFDGRNRRRNLRPVTSSRIPTPV